MGKEINIPGRTLSLGPMLIEGAEIRMSYVIAFSRIIDRVNRLIGNMVPWLILASIFVCAGNAISRKFFNASSNGWLELQWYLFGAAFLLAAAHTLERNEHVRIDIIFESLPRRVQLWIDAFGSAVFLLPFALLMIFLLLPYVYHSIASGEHSGNTGGLILWPAKLLLLISFGQLFLQAISEIVKLSIALTQKNGRKNIVKK